MSSYPFLKWAGGKRGLLPELEKRVPKFSGTYFEPFLGGGALFFHLEPKTALLSDANAYLVETYKCVRDDPRAVIELLEHKVNEESFYYRERDAELERLSAFGRAARFVYLNRTCFNGLYRVNKKGKFNVPFGGYKSPDIVGRERILQASAALAGADVFAIDFEVAVAGALRDSFVYFDPPYAPVSKTSSFTAFEKGGFGEREQERLRDLCLALVGRGVPFLLSNSDCPFTRDLYASPKLRIETVFAKRAINSKGDRRGAVPELLVSPA